jgi:response regulator RpfG family c-di-GMP phosphodiesterase
METVSFPPQHAAERHWQVTAAFFSHAIGSTDAVSTVVERLYRHDPESLSHLQRVAQLAGIIADEMGQSPAQQARLEQAALLHDLGRLILADGSAVSIGAATSHLAAVTMRQRVQQVRLVTEAVADLPYLRPAAELIEASLECYDGSGFPRGLRGHDIPLGARILSVADTVDALTSVCLSLQCPPDVAAREIVQRTGERFDPEVVQAWLRAIGTPTLMTPPVGLSARRMH